MSEGVSPSPKGTHPGFGFNTDNFLGGFIIAVLALFLLACTFLIPSLPPFFRFPTTVVGWIALIFDPRVLSIAVAAVAVAIAAGFIPVRNPRDLYGGLAFIEIAIFALIASA